MRPSSRCIVVKLPNPLSADSQNGANLLVCDVLVVVKAKIEMKNLAIPIGKLAEGRVHIPVHGILDKGVFGMKVMGIRQGFLQIGVGVVII